MFSSSGREGDTDGVEVAEQQADVARLAQTVGAADAVYMLDFRTPESWLGRNWGDAIRTRGGLHHSSEQSRHFADRSKRITRGNDDNLSRAVQRDRHLWQLSARIPSAVRQSRLMTEYGYGQKVILTLDLPGCPELVGRCFLLFRDERHRHPGEFWEAFSASLRQKEEILHARHVALATSGVQSPFEGYGLIKPGARKVLSIAARGGKREEIARHCHLSMRGVDYHLERLRDLLGVRNNTALVYRAARMRII